MIFCFDTFLTKVLTNFDVHTEVNSYQGLKNKNKRNKTKRNGKREIQKRYKMKRNEMKRKKK
jgi:hypothetical protein